MQKTLLKDQLDVQIKTKVSKDTHLTHVEQLDWINESYDDGKHENFVWTSRATNRIRPQDVPAETAKLARS